VPDPGAGPQGREVAIRRALAALFGAVLVGSSASRADADGPPPAPPPAPARAVVEASPCAREGSRRGLVRLEVEGHLATLTPDPEGVLTLDSGTPGQARWDSADYDAQYGGRVAVTWPQRGDGQTSFAATWWGRWQDTEVTNGTLASTAMPGDPLNVTSATPIGLRAEADLWDARLVTMRPIRAARCFDVAWGWGVRYLRCEEEAAFLFPTSVPPENAAVFAADTANGLLAAELTARGTWQFAARLSLTASASVFGGWMRQSGRLSTVNVNPPPAVSSDHEDAFGFGAEAEVALRWRVDTRWSLTAGYGVLLVGPVARAFEAFDFSNVASSNLGPVLTEDTLVLQRVFVGVGLDL
jgi:hypothetical protein